MKRNKKPTRKRSTPAASIIPFITLGAFIALSLAAWDRHLDIGLDAEPETQANIVRLLNEIIPPPKIIAHKAKKHKGMDEKQVALILVDVFKDDGGCDFIPHGPRAVRPC